MKEVTRVAIRVPAKNIVSGFPVGLGAASLDKIVKTGSYFDPEYFSLSSFFMSIPCSRYSGSRKSLSRSDMPGIFAILSFALHQLEKR